MCFRPEDILALMTCESVLQGDTEGKAGAYLCSRRSIAREAGLSDLQQSAGMLGSCHEPCQAACSKGAGVSLSRQKESRPIHSLLDWKDMVCR